MASQLVWSNLRTWNHFAWHVLVVLAKVAARNLAEEQETVLLIAPVHSKLSHQLKNKNNYK